MPSGESVIPPVPSARRKGSGKQLVVRGAREHNLKGIDVGFPLGTFICVTGVSGSGKSTLINEILYKACARALYRALERPGTHDRLEGIQFLDKVVEIDQSRSAGRRAPTRPPTPRCLTRSVSCSP